MKQTAGRVIGVGATGAAVTVEPGWTVDEAPGDVAATTGGRLKKVK